MSGRGVDQVLRHPGDPRFLERWMTSALGYVALAEQGFGPISRGVDPAYVWGAALDVLRDEEPDAFVVNLEAAVTDGGSRWPGKGIQYRMHPANVDLSSRWPASTPRCWPTTTSWTGPSPGSSRPWTSWPGLGSPPKGGS
jgi:poly-gamma-glutamate capsule biosynthesis protein CapA/YwtB (metallophosphatase superfamily)